MELEIDGFLFYELILIYTVIIRKFYNNVVKLVCLYNVCSCFFNCRGRVYCLKQGLYGLISLKYLLFDLL